MSGSIEGRDDGDVMAMDWEPVICRAVMPRRLGLVFDIDGTLILQPPPKGNVIERDGTVEFLAGCLVEGHGLALWTAGKDGWADKVAAHLCEKVQAHLQKGPHVCSDPLTCGRTFTFVWHWDHNVRQKATAETKPSRKCVWCGPYADGCSCTQCATNPRRCICRYIKPLQKVWDNPPDERFALDNVLMIENTPEKCIANLENSIFVPTCHSGVPRTRQDTTWQKLAGFLQKIPEGMSVRDVVKCRSNIPHPCCHHCQVWR